MTGGRVVVLGKVGRNFAAGMSGGIAYLYGPSDAFFLTCNKEMVSLEKPDQTDLIELRKIIRKHFHYTGSISALEVLSDWDQKSKNFLKVIPVEYKGVLEKNDKINIGSKNQSETVNN